jgi:hypothetical protein
MMARVEIHPLPQRYHAIPPLYRPGHPPIFPDGSPTSEDRELARRLFAALDRESQEWYLSGGSWALFAGVKLARR